MPPPQVTGQSCHADQSSATGEGPQSPNCHTVHTVHVTVLILAVRANTVTGFLLFGVTACLAEFSPWPQTFHRIHTGSVKRPAAHLRLTTVFGCLYDGPGSTPFPRTVRSTFAPVLQHYARAVLKGSILRLGIRFGSCWVSFAIQIQSNSAMARTNRAVHIIRCKTF